MTTEQLNTALYEMMFEEQERYRSWLLSQPPEEILNHTYEYTIREDILLSMEYYELNGRQAAALLGSPSPLAAVFKDFEKREDGHMESIRDAIEKRADTLIENSGKNKGNR